MAVYSKIVLSGSSEGAPIGVTGLAVTTANTIHQAVTAGLDEVWVYAFNTATADMELTVDWGATAANATSALDPWIRKSIASQDGLHLIVPGLPLQGGRYAQAFATAALTSTGGLHVVGYVNRVT